MGTWDALSYEGKETILRVVRQVRGDRTVADRCLNLFLRT